MHFMLDICLSCPISIGGQGGEVQTHSEHQGLLTRKIRHSHVCHSGWGWAVGPPPGGRHLHLPADVSADDGLRYRSNVPWLYKTTILAALLSHIDEKQEKLLRARTQENQAVHLSVLVCVWCVAQVCVSSQTWTRSPSFKTWCSTLRLPIKWRWVKSTCFNRKQIPIRSCSWT